MNYFLFIIFFHLFITLIVPEVFIGEKITLFPETSCIKLNEVIIISFVWFEHLIIPRFCFKSSSNNHNPVLFASFNPKYLQIDFQKLFIISFCSNTSSFSEIILNNIYLLLSIFPIIHLLPLLLERQFQLYLYLDAIQLSLKVLTHYQKIPFLP